MRFLMIVGVVIVALFMSVKGYPLYDINTGSFVAKNDLIFLAIAAIWIFYCDRYQKKHGTLWDGGIIGRALKKFKEDKIKKE